MKRHEQFCWLVQLEAERLEQIPRSSMKLIPAGLVAMTVWHAMNLDTSLLPGDLYEAAREYAMWQYGIIGAKPEWAVKYEAPEWTRDEV